MLLTQKLVTVDVFYYLPDYPSLINEFVWQCDDVVPNLPRVHRFLNYWKQNNLAVISQVLVAISDNKNYRSADLIVKLNHF